MCGREKQEQTMSNIIQELEREMQGDKQLPDFRPGDTVVVQVKVKECELKRR